MQAIDHSKVLKSTYRNQKKKKNKAHSQSLPQRRGEKQNTAEAAAAGKLENSTIPNNKGSTKMQMQRQGEQRGVGNLFFSRK
jgi:hypothetical protein